MLLTSTSGANAPIAHWIDLLVEQGAHLGWILIKAFLVFIIGRLAISLINKLVEKIFIIDSFGGRCIRRTDLLVCGPAGFSRCCHRYGLERESVKLCRRIDYPGIQTLQSRRFYRGPRCFRDGKGDSDLLYQAFHDR